MIKTIKEIKEQYPDIDINLNGGTDSFQEGLPIVERYNVAIIIKHPSENSYLISQWKKSNWNGFITGGIEEGETLADTARKEIPEECGYKHVSKIIPFDFVSHGLFFHPVKNVNRLAHYQLVFVELADLEKEEVSEEEKSIADFVWVPADQVLDMLTGKDMKLLWRYYLDHVPGSLSV